MWYFNGNAYDLSEFIERHPGGAHLIRETNGFDITYLVQCNHNWTRESALKKLQKFKVGSKPQNNITVTEDEKLQQGLKIMWDDNLEDMQQKLKKQGIDIRDLKTPWYGWLYYMCFGFFYIYFALQWLMYNKYGAFFGIFGWLWGGFIQHEAAHNALSHNKNINNIFRYAIIPWTDPQSWFKKHSIMHHQFTNTKLDSDFQHNNDFVRHHADKLYTPFMKFQILSITIYSTVISILYNIGYVTVIQVTLIYLHYHIHSKILSSCLPFICFGIIFTFVTQLNHVQEEAVSKELLEKPQDFVRHQINSCVDYSHDNLIVSSLSIFLNYQTYHHLFPIVSHFHFLRLRNEIDIVLQDSDYGKTNSVCVTNVIKGYYQYLWSLSLNK